MRRIGLLCAALAIGSCGGGVNGHFQGSGDIVGPTAINSPVLVIQPVTPLVTCVVGPSLFADVTLLITTGPVSTVDTVTIRLIDGSSVGGPSITFPQAQITNMFGTSVVIGTRQLTFPVQFPCTVATARSMAVNAELVDQTNVRRVVSAVTSF